MCFLIKCRHPSSWRRVRPHHPKWCAREFFTVDVRISKAAAWWMKGIMKGDTRKPSQRKPLRLFWLLIIAPSARERFFRLGGFSAASDNCSAGLKFSSFIIPPATRKALPIACVTVEFDFCGHHFFTFRWWTRHWFFNSTQQTTENRNRSARENLN